MRTFACLCSVALLMSGCIVDDASAVDSPDGEPTSAGPIVTLPSLPSPDLPPSFTHSWADNARVFDFDAYASYGVNLVDPSALTITIPGALSGDTLQVSANGVAYSDHPQTDGIRCYLRAFVTEGGVERPFDFGGGATSFDLGADVRAEREVTLAGSTRVQVDGTVRVRVLGRVSRPDRFCGLAAPVSLHIVHGW